MRSRSFFALAALFLSIAAGCGNLRVNPASPKPNVDLPPPITPAKLEVDAGVADSFVIAKTDSVNEVPVSGWRTTLKNGFDNGFKGGNTGLVLLVRKADLSFAPAAIGSGGTAAVRAHIKFQVTLLERSGQEIGRISGEVDAHDAATSPTPEAMTANAAQAVESMYEGIAYKISEAAQNAASGAKD